MAKPTDRFPGSASLARTAGFLGLGALVVFVVIGVIARVDDDPASAAFGALIALGAGIPMFLVRPRYILGCAGVATVGIVLLGNADSRVISWFAVVVVAAWCVLAAGIRAGIVYWVASVLLFGGEWLWAIRDPGWAPWTAGVTVTVLASILIRHELVLIERLRSAQVDLAERSRTEERNRIARELHDVIAHTLTVSLLHISSARLAIEHDPADATRALGEAERLGRESLAEVRATMGLLGSAGGGVVAPVPGVDQVPRLVDQLRGAGADISLVIDGDIAGLPATTGATAYRIVQEALTNAIKYAPGSAVSVRVDSNGRPLDISVDSSGNPGHGSGMGLESMEVRAEAVGGLCMAGPGGSGWLVRASLPFEASRNTGSP